MNATPAPRRTGPFRADHVGSLLRPQRLLDARKQRDEGKLPATRLREVEDECIREAVHLQEEVGLRVVTDGEFRRNSWNKDRGLQVPARGDAVHPQSLHPLADPDAFPRWPRSDQPRRLSRHGDVLRRSRARL
jgi:hypothetical protein